MPFNFIQPLIMAFLSKQLFVRKSSIPASGRGLFTKKKIRKGERIVEYKGKRTTWKEANHLDGSNGYLFYIDRNHVVDAFTYRKSMGRYANDAKGTTRRRGLSNNSTYETDNEKVYIEAAKDIPAGSEILVDYGKEYWDVMLYNNKLSSPK
jgi:uncharacterized protein